MSTSSAPKGRAPKVPRARSQDGPSREARRLAAAVLEVLAGMRTPTEAAGALSVSVPRYYALEQRALESLVAGCEPRAGRPHKKGPQQRIAELEREVERLRQQCDRLQALARVSQRTLGLPAAPKSAATGTGKASGSSGKKRRKRRPTVRALKAAQSLRDTPPDDPASTATETVSRPSHS